MPDPLKLFISYRSSDAPKVDKIARDLALLKREDGTAYYKPWQDKYNLPPASPHWWDAIVDAIGESQVFVFHISQESLKSEVCRAELDYAHKRNRPIVSIVLDGEFFLDPKSGKYNISYWSLVPDWLGEQQLMFYTGADFYRQFQWAIERFERNWPPDVYAPRPLNPDSKGEYINNHALYDQACDYAERLAFSEAERCFENLLRRNDRDYGAVAAEWLELLRRYAELIEIYERPRSRFMFRPRWNEYIALFPKEFLDGLFDPKGFANQDNSKPQVPPQAIKQPIHATSTSRAKAPASAPVAPSVAKSLTAEDYFGRAERYRVSREYDSAITDYTEAIRLNPQYARAYNSRAYVYLAKGNLAQALVDCDLALKIDPQNSNIYDSRGDVHFARRNYDAAIADYSQAISLNPEFALAYVNRGIIYFTKKDYDRAMKDFEEAIHLNPQYARAYNNRAYVYLAKGNLDDALSDCNLALKFEPRNANIYDSRGDVYFAKGEYDKAIADYETALQIDPAVRFAQVNLKKTLEIKQKKQS